MAGVAGSTGSEVEEGAIVGNWSPESASYPTHWTASASPPTSPVPTSPTSHSEAPDWADFVGRYRRESSGAAGEGEGESSEEGEDHDHRHVDGLGISNGHVRQETASSDADSVMHNALHSKLAQLGLRNPTMPRPRPNSPSHLPVDSPTQTQTQRLEQQPQQLVNGHSNHVPALLVTQPSASFNNNSAAAFAYGSPSPHDSAYSSDPRSPPTDWQQPVQIETPPPTATVSAPTPMGSKNMLSSLLTNLASTGVAARHAPDAELVMRGQSTARIYNPDNPSSGSMPLQRTPSSSSSGYIPIGPVPSNSSFGSMTMPTSGLAEPPGQFATYPPPILLAANGLSNQNQQPAFLQQPSPLYRQTAPITNAGSATFASISESRKLPLQSVQHASPPSATLSAPGLLGIPKSPLAGSGSVSLPLPPTQQEGLHPYYSPYNGTANGVVNGNPPLPTNSTSSSASFYWTPTKGGEGEETSPQLIPVVPAASAPLKSTTIFSATLPATLPGLNGSNYFPQPGSVAFATLASGTFSANAALQTMGSSASSTGSGPLPSAGPAYGTLNQTLPPLRTKTPDFSAIPAPKPVSASFAKLASTSGGKGSAAFAALASSTFSSQAFSTMASSTLSAGSAGAPLKPRIKASQTLQPSSAPLLPPTQANHAVFGRGVKSTDAGIVCPKCLAHNPVGSMTCISCGNVFNLPPERPKSRGAGVSGTMRADGMIGTPNSASSLATPASSGTAHAAALRRSKSVGNFAERGSSTLPPALSTSNFASAASSTLSAKNAAQLAMGNTLPAGYAFPLPGQSPTGWANNTVQAPEGYRAMAS